MVERKKHRNTDRKIVKQTDKKKERHKKMKESNRLGLEVGSWYHAELFGVFVWLKVGR